MATNKKTRVRSKSDGKSKRSKTEPTARKKAAAGPKKRRTKRVSATKPAKSTKSSQVLKLLARRHGATLAELMAATGWQAHSVRGFLSGTVRKRLKLPLVTEMTNGERHYRIDAGNSPKDAS